jgi:hypothetical protein
MQGRYSGTWTSDSLYHFQVFNTDLHLEIAIQGTLSAYVAPDGTVTGSATGTVDAPITHDGAKDVSSGYGTISGSISGKLNSGDVQLVLAHPIIDMHWGTFVGGGYTVEKFITMNDYVFALGSFDCASAGGSVSEQNFPVMEVIADGANQMTYAPGIGVAGGSWSLQSDKTAQFSALSSRVDSFISASNTLLGDTSQPLSAAMVDREIAAPLKSLIAEIRADPDTSRCLLERLAAWETTAVSALLHRPDLAAAGPNVEAFRRAGDLIRAAQLLDVLCNLPSAESSKAFGSGLSAAIDRAISQRHWTEAALLMRESVIFGMRLEPAVATDLHALLPGSKDNGAALELARVAYALGDDADSASAAARLTTAAKLSTPVKHRKPQKKKKPAHKPVPRPTPTATPKPKPTLSQLLTGHIAPLKVTIDGHKVSWSPLPVATSYILTVKTPAGLVWTWSGSDSSAAVGDTSLTGLSGYADDVPPEVELSGALWTVLALDAKGQIVAGTFRQAS